MEHIEQAGDHLESANNQKRHLMDTNWKTLLLPLSVFMLISGLVFAACGGSTTNYTWTTRLNFEAQNLTNNDTSTIPGEFRLNYSQSSSLLDEASSPAIGDADNAYSIINWVDLDSTNNRLLMAGYPGTSTAAGFMYLNLSDQTTWRINSSGLYNITDGVNGIFKSSTPRITGIYMTNVYYNNISGNTYLSTDLGLTVIKGNGSSYLYNTSGLYDITTVSPSLVNATPKVAGDRTTFSLMNGTHIFIGTLAENFVPTGLTIIDLTTNTSVTYTTTGKYNTTNESAPSDPIPGGPVLPDDYIYSLYLDNDRHLLFMAMGDTFNNAGVGLTILNLSSDTITSYSTGISPKILSNDVYYAWGDNNLNRIYVNTLEGTSVIDLATSTTIINYSSSSSPAGTPNVPYWHTFSWLDPATNILYITTDDYWVGEEGGMTAVNLNTNTSKNYNMYTTPPTCTVGWCGEAYSMKKDDRTGLIYIATYEGLSILNTTYTTPATMSNITNLGVSPNTTQRSISWSQSLPTGSNIIVSVSEAANQSGPWTPYTNFSSVSDFASFIFNSSSNYQYIKWLVNLSTTNTAATPSLKEINVSFAEVCTLGCGDNITSSTTLTENIPDCPGNGLNITADNIVLDCNGHTISGLSAGAGIYATRSGANAYKNLTIKNCIISDFLVSVDARGAYNPTAAGYNGGNVSLTNSTAATVYSYGGDTGGDFAAGGNGGAITIINSTVTTADAHGRTMGDGSGGNGASITITNSNVATASSYGGSSGGGSGGSAGAIIITNSNVTTSNANGGTGQMGGGSDGATITITNSNVTTVSSSGGDSWNTAGNGGNVNLISSIINLPSTINVAGGSGGTPGTSGTLVLNKTAFVSSNGMINFTYVSTQETAISSILSISSNFISVDSATYPDYNTSANLTLYSVPVFSGPKIYRNGVECNSTTTPSCYNFTALNGTVIFNVSGFTNYSIGEAPPTGPSCGDNITSNTTLTANLTCSGTALNIQADSLVIDCAGQSIIGNGTGFGINATTSTDGYNITVKNCTISNFTTSINASGAIRSTSGTGYKGGNITIENSNMAMIDVYGGKRITVGGIGGIGGNANLINSNVTTINAYGGIGYMSTGGVGGSITITDSIITTITTANAYGGGGSGAPGGTGGNVVVLNSNLNLTNIIINISGGTGTSKGTDGTLKLNNTEFYNPSGKIKFGYVSTQNTTFSSIMGISSNFITLDSATYPSYSVSGNLTLYSVPVFSTPAILRNGVKCNSTTSPSCYNFTALNGTVTFNVSGFTNYTIGEAPPSGLNCGANITSDTTLTASLACNGTAIYVGASNITLDCNGYTITGNGTGIGINAATATNAYTNLTVKNCTISNFITSINASGAVRSTSGTPYNGGNVTIENSNMAMIDVYGGKRITTMGTGGTGGNANLINSIVTTINAYGGIGYSGAAAGAGGNITLTDSIITTANSYGGDGSGGGSPGGSGGKVVITNSNVTTADSHGGSGSASPGGAGGIITVADSNVTTANAYGGYGGGGAGGAGGSITLTDSIITTANSSGGNCVGGSNCGIGGSITITNSNITTAYSYGGSSTGGSGGGNGGSITMIDSNLSLTNIAVNISGGTGPSSNGTAGTLKLNQTSLENANGKIKFSYVSTQNTSFSSILSISSNLITLDSATYPSYNSSANLTLYSVPVFGNPAILRNGVECNSGTSPSCYNFTSLTAGTVVFNVSGFTNYSIGAGNTAPTVNLQSPADTSTTYTNASSASITFIFNYTDDFSSTANCTLHIAGGNNGTNASVANGTATSMTVNGIVPGAYSWNVTCLDGADLQGSSANRSFTVYGTGVTACGSLSTENLTYYLQNNLSPSGTCFNVAANNVTLDCAAHTITGDGTGYGINATTATNGYNVTVKNCTISNFAVSINASGANNLSGNGYTGGNVNLINSNITTVDSHGGAGTTDGGGHGGNGGSITITDSNVTTADSYGGFGHNGGNGGSITITNSNITTADSYGGSANIPSSGGGGSGGTIIVTNSSVTTANSYGGGGWGSEGGAGGSITVTDSNVTTADSHGGIGGDSEGGAGGSITVTDSNVTTADSHGGSGYNHGRGGGIITITDSNVTIVDSHGGDGEYGDGGNGGTVNSVNSALNLSNIVINVTGGAAPSGTPGTAGTLILNQTSLENANGKIKFSYVSTQNTSFASIMSISPNLISLDSVNYPNYSVSANLTIYNSPYPNPKILRNGTNCPPDVCSILSTAGGNVLFSVTGFTNYSIGNASVITGCQDLSTAGETYYLQNNVSSASDTCINVTANNVTLDCQGYQITSNYSGLNILGSSDIVRNCSVSSNGRGVYLGPGASNTFITNCTVNSVNEGLYFDNNYPNLVTVTNLTVSGNPDMYAHAAEVVKLVDQPIASYNFQFPGTFLIVENSSAGKIDFSTGGTPISGSGTNLTNDIRVSQNFAYVDSAAHPGFNQAANITFYSPSPSGFPPYKVVRDGVNECNDTTTPSCNNFTALNAATVIFGVSGFTNYSIMGLGVSGSSNIIAPPGVFEPYNASLSGTHVNTFGIKFVDLNIHSDETLTCTIRQSNGTLFNVNVTGLSLVGTNYTLNYTITSGDSIINDPVAGYIPWELKNCTLTNASGTIFNQTIDNRIYVHAPVYWSDSEVTRAVTCQGTPGVYFNNTAKCGFSGDTVFALQMRNGNSVEPSCFNNPGTGCSNSYCTGIYFPSCAAPSYFYGYNATSDDPNGYSTFTASFSGYSTPVAYTQYVNSSGTFKLKVTQALTGKPFSFTIYNLTNASNVGGASNVYGPNTGAGTLSVTDQGDGTWSVAYYRFSSFTGTLDFTFNISFTNTSLQQNRSAYLVIAYGTDTNQGSPPYFNVNFSPSFGLRNANESENTSITIEYGGACGDRVNNDFDYLGAGGSWTNSYDCYDPDCNGFLGDYFQTNEFGSGKTGLCNYGGEMNCTDEFDNDYDGLTDCHDTDCFQNASKGCPVIETVCNDSINNDFDYTDASLLIEHNGSRYGVFGTTALTDCLDPDCNGLRGGNASQFCAWGYETSCNDGFNNDALQLADCNVSTLGGVTTMPGVSNGEYDCAVYCRANVQATETGILCDNNKDDDFDAVVVTGPYTGTANNSYGAGTDCRWLDYNPDEDCNMTILSSGKRCELGRELTCNDSFDNDFDSYASLSYRPSAGWNSSYYLATFNLTYLANADYADYDCRGASGSITNESQNASWCFDNVDNDLDAYYRTGDTWTLNSSTGVDCNDPDCLGVVNPANANQTCMKYEYNATDSFFTSLPNPGFYCTNGIDDDGDNWKGWPNGGTDCRDPDCNKKFDICTGPCYNSEAIFWNTCKDSIDNDYDMPTGMTDCADSDCVGLIGANSGAFCQATETVCNDNFDNNANSLTDCADHSSCDDLQGGTVNGTAVYCRASESTVADCFDGFDNDADGAADCYDTGCNAACNLSTISGSSPITLPQWTGITSINSVSNAYIRNYTNKIKKGDWYSITFTDTSASTNAQWTLGTASGARFTKTSFNTATAILSGVSSGNFTLTETANGFIMSSNGNSMPSGYNVTFAIQSTSTLASSTYELTYIEESGAKTSLNNYITHEVVEDTAPTAQSIQVIPGSTGIPYGGTVYVRANASDATGLGLCSWSVAGPPGESFTPADSTQCRGSFSPTVEGDYNITVTPKDYYSNTGTSLVKAYTVNILPVSSSIQINRAVPFYNQSANDTVTINATFNVPTTDSLGTCQVVVRSDNNSEILLESFAAVGSSCNKSGVNISSLSDGKYRAFVRVTETTDSNLVDSSSIALFVCSNVTSGACRYADYNSDGKADVCNTTAFTCGNGVLNTETGEECDPGPPLQLAGQSCGSKITGYVGSLGCTSSCTFDTSSCSPPTPQQDLPMSISASAGCDGDNINLTVTSSSSPVNGVSIRVSKAGVYLGYVYTGGDGKVTYTSSLGVSGTYTFEATKSGYNSASTSASVTVCPRIVSYTTQSKLLCSMTGGCRVKVYLTLTGTVQTGTAANISISSLSGIINPASISIADRNGNSLSSVKDANIIRISSIPAEGFVLDATTNISTAIKQQNADNLTISISNTGSDIQAGGTGEITGSGTNTDTAVPDLSFNITDPAWIGKTAYRVYYTPEGGSRSQVDFTYASFVVKITTPVSVRHALSSNEVLIDFTPPPAQCTDGNTVSCYTGPGGTSGVGQCHNGTQTCSGGQWGSCSGQVVPSTEICGNAVDDDCNGAVDETCASCTSGQTRSCYTGPSGTNGTGRCINGLQTCPSSGNWSLDYPACIGQVTPASTDTCGNSIDDNCNGVVDEPTGQPDVCGNELDDNCNGQIDEGCVFCVLGQTRSCYTGPTGTVGVGVCVNGSQACPTGGYWSSTWPSCSGQMTPSGTDTCSNNLDDNCNGYVDEGCACVPFSVIPCGPANVGECHKGNQTCSPEGVWIQSCVNAMYPTSEVCDGKDNNCNGVADDGLGNVTCGTGACYRSVASCVGGVQQTCTPGQPAANETCGNSIDDNCDGVIDNGCECVPQSETCNGLDDNCDTFIDNGIAPMNCSMYKGICSVGAQTCQGGTWVGCPFPQNETCNGVDDNCDGTVDEGCPCISGQNYTCGPANSTGECRLGSSVCINGVFGNCTGAVYPAAETCDGKDNNCNGVADDSIIPRNCNISKFGICAIGFESCSNSTFSGCPLSQAEQCNGIDDDCDGIVDNGCVCVPGTTQSCGPATEAGICKKGVNTCTNGSWSETCAGAVYPAAEQCGNGVDEDCSGTDLQCSGCRSGSECDSGKCVNGNCLSVTFSTRESHGVVVDPGFIREEKPPVTNIIPASVLQTFGIATEVQTKTCDIGTRCSITDDCFDSQCIDGTCACCVQTCVRSGDCCTGYCDQGKCKLPPSMAPFIVRNPSAFSGCAGLIQECLPGEQGCISICNAMTILLAIVGAGTMFAFWRSYKSPVIALGSLAIPIVLSVITYPFVGVIISLLMIGMLFAK